MAIRPSGVDQRRGGINDLSKIHDLPRQVGALPAGRHGVHVTPEKVPSQEWELCTSSIAFTSAASGLLARQSHMAGSLSAPSVPKSRLLAGVNWTVRSVRHRYGRSWLVPSPRRTATPRPHCDFPVVYYQDVSRNRG